MGGGPSVGGRDWAWGALEEISGEKENEVNGVPEVESFGVRPGAITEPGAVASDKQSIKGVSTRKIC